MEQEILSFVLNSFGQRNTEAEEFVNALFSSYYCYIKLDIIPG